jgi:hypothetical protein
MSTHDSLAENLDHRPKKQRTIPTGYAMHTAFKPGFEIVKF